MEYKELEVKVLNWADDKGLIKYENRHKQALKMVSEVGELCDALIKDDKPMIIDGLGDVLVTLIILSAQNVYSLESCLEEAYREIADRTGETVNGTFIKD
jgi:NTP pyrophosphatase (non-canonical NTP hydrolase)